ncbi:MAG: hypothetical protein KDE46_31060, partial [Caldilineaceae bacterium]|nr:hypothetical protein [Caldilineaceae bacterium]
MMMGRPNQQPSTDNRQPPGKPKRETTIPKTKNLDMKSHLSAYVQISMMSRERENFANFAHAGPYRQAIDRILNLFLIPMLLFLAFPAAQAQRITLEGRVSILNSEYHTGKIEYVEGALVSAPYATTEATNKKGIFKLEFAAVDGGNS